MMIVYATEPGSCARRHRPQQSLHRALRHIDTEGASIGDVMIAVPTTC